MHTRVGEGSKGARPRKLFKILAKKTAIVHERLNSPLMENIKITIILFFSNFASMKKF